MRSKGLFLFLSVLVVFSSCSRNSAIVKNDKSFAVNSISAVYTEIEESTKNSMGSVNYDVYWSEGDAIAIVNMTDGTIHQYVADAEKTVGNKNGPFNAVGSYTYNDDDVLVAVYPYDAASWAGGVLSVTLKNAVNYAPANNAAFSSNDIQVSPQMTGSAFKAIVEAQGNLTFKRMVALFTINCHVSTEVFADENLSDITIEHSGICGKANITFTEGEPSISASAGSGESMAITLTTAPVMSNLNFVAKYIPVFPANLSSGLYFVLNSTNYVTGFYRQVSTTISRNSIQVFSLFEGAYTEVFSQDEATFDKSWWYVSNEGGKNNPGAFENGSDTQYGSTAGRFTE